MRLFTAFLTPWRVARQRSFTRMRWDGMTPRQALDYWDVDAGYCLDRVLAADIA